MARVSVFNAFCRRNSIFLHNQMGALFSFPRRRFCSSEDDARPTVKLAAKTTEGAGSVKTTHSFLIKKLIGGGVPLDTALLIPTILDETLKRIKDLEVEIEQETMQIQLESEIETERIRLRDLKLKLEVERLKEHLFWVKERNKMIDDLNKIRDELRHFTEKAVVTQSAIEMDGFKADIMADIKGKCEIPRQLLDKYLLEVMKLRSEWESTKTEVLKLCVAIFVSYGGLLLAWMQLWPKK